MSPWDKRRLKHLCSTPIVNGLGERGEHDDPSWPRYIRTTDIAGPSQLRSDTFRSLPPEVASKATLEPGDMLMTAAGATIGKSYTFEEQYPACFAGYLVRFRPNGSIVHGPFLRYWMQSADYWAQVDARRVKSTIENFSASKYADLSIDLPPLTAQRAIADYLDTESARIDALIAKKRKLLHLLNSALATRIEHLLRQHSTQLVPLRRLLLSPPEYGAGESGDAGNDVSGWPRYIRITDLRSDGSLRPEDAKVLEPDLARPYFLSAGDVLVARSGATVGKAFIYRETMEPAAFAGYLIRLRFDPRRLDPSVFFHWTRTRQYWDQIDMSAVQATIQNVSAERYKELLIPVPEREDQGALIREFERVAAASAKAKTSLAAQLERLAEHRQALITAAVTGELEIPGLAA